jgi:hypothetical protein
MTPAYIDKLLENLRQEVQAELSSLDNTLDDMRRIAAAAVIRSEKARNIALEALSEIRHLRSQLTAAASTKPSPETRRETAPSRSRGRRV